MPDELSSTYATPSSRPLRIFAFDPSLGRQFSNHMTVHVPFEQVSAGPIGNKVAVVDWDFSCQTFYETVDLDDRWVLMNNGLSPAEGDPRFHQQMVYAVVSETVARFEAALGREIKWGQPHGQVDKKLRVFPHAFQQANAFYHPDLCALLFGYFTAHAENDGPHRVFTCLSHDIIAHETTHAVLDSLRLHFAKPTGPDTLAFHEAFADIVALFLHFSVEEAVFDTIQRTGGMLFKPALDPMAAAVGAEVLAQIRRENPLVCLAQQFGHGMGRRSALRRALSEEPDPSKMKTVTEPHLRGSILVAAVFDAFFTAYLARTRDLMRLAGMNGEGGARDLHHDLARRLTREATKTASHFLNMCIRAIDYCPPVDIRFGEFLRAVITADRELVPDDRYDYRGALIEAFRCRGIYPDGVASFSEDLLAWEVPERPMHCSIDFRLKPNGVGSSVDIILESNQMEFLAEFAASNKEQLGLKQNVRPWSIQPIRRTGPDGRLQVEFAVEFVETREELLDESDRQGPKFIFYGGAAVIFDANGAAKYTIRKSARNSVRLAEQRRFQWGFVNSMATTAFTGATVPPNIHFGMVHGGM